MLRLTDFKCCFDLPSYSNNAHCYNRREDENYPVLSFSGLFLALKLFSSFHKLNINKLLEHIVCRHVLNHLEKHNILTSLHRGFKRGFSCETPLLITMHDILQAFDKNLQTNIVILNFSKAFDTLPHKLSAKQA